MTNASGFQLTFPCPACGAQLTIQSNTATGPCPHCAETIEATFSATVSKEAVEPVKLKPKFAERRFRPSTTVPPTGPRPSHKLSDYVS